MFVKLYTKYINCDCFYDFQLEIIRIFLSSCKILNIHQIAKPTENYVKLKKENSAKKTKEMEESMRVSRKECKGCKPKKGRKQTVYQVKCVQEIQNR